MEFKQIQNNNNNPGIIPTTKTITIKMIMKALKVISK